MDIRDIICPCCDLRDVISVRLRLVNPPSKFALVAVYGEGEQEAPVILDSYEPERDVPTTGRKLRTYSSPGQRCAIAFISWRDKHGDIHQCQSCNMELAE